MMACSKYRDPGTRAAPSKLSRLLRSAALSEDNSVAKCVSDGSPNCSMPNRPALGARIILSMKLRANSLLAAQSEVVMDVLESSARYTSTLQTGSKPSPGCHCGAMFTGGQESVLHSRVSVVLPHSTPPLDGGTKMDRVRLEIPPSQLSVQSPQSSHPVMLQSTGTGYCCMVTSQWCVHTLGRRT